MALLSLLLLPLLFSTSAIAYVPASPTNSTKDAIAGGLNVTDISKLRLQWYSNGSYTENVSYQLVGNGSQGISKGALIHFSEESVNELTPPTSAPWIAMVSCDTNATNASMEVDIFTLARDKGAVAALLYSLRSLACVINPEYADPATFDQVFDIFSTQSKTSAHLIDYQFGQLLPANTSLSKYDSQRLNDSADAIKQSIGRGYPTVPGFLFAVLQANNATGDSTDPLIPDAGDGNENEGRARSSKTALAMIVLYAITGCVSALFCVVIISGAIRALRHPERYGPRARLGLDGPPQSRARGLTRAILDTFPVVKFGGAVADEEGSSAMHAAGGPSAKDPEAQELTQWEVVDQTTGARQGTSTTRNGEPITPALAPAPNEALQTSAATDAVQREPLAAAAASPRLYRSQSPNQNTTRRPDPGEGPSLASPPPSSPHDDQHLHAVSVRDNLSPDSMGRETCPICIVDFEEGDDLRVLPCEGKHRFHQQCVDPWLLELSSSCPICRHDFLALETLLSDEDNGEGQEFDVEGLYSTRDHRHPQQPHGSRRSVLTASMYGSNRFSRYLRFASRRRHQRQQQEVREEELQEQEQQRQEGLGPHMSQLPGGSIVMHHDI